MAVMQRIPSDHDNIPSHMADVEMYGVNIFGASTTKIFC